MYSKRIVLSIHTRSFAVDELTGTDGEPASVPRLERAGRPLEEIAFHAGPVELLGLEQRHQVLGGDDAVPIAQVLLQGVGLLSQLAHLFPTPTVLSTLRRQLSAVHRSGLTHFRLDRLQERIHILEQVRSLVEERTLGVHVGQQLRRAQNPSSKCDFNHFYRVKTVLRDRELRDVSWTGRR